MTDSERDVPLATTAEHEAMLLVAKADAACPFGPVFFLRQLGRFVRESLPVTRGAPSACSARAGRWRDARSLSRSGSIAKVGRPRSAGSRRARA